MITPIKVKNIKDIESINRIVCRYDFDIWIHGKSGMVDAKSILGLYVLGLDESLSLVVPDNVNSVPLFKDLAEYLIIG